MSRTYDPLAHFVSDVVTPEQLASEVGVAERAIRKFLRDQGWQSVHYSRWKLTADQAAKVRANFSR